MLNTNTIRRTVLTGVTALTLTFTAPFAQADHIKTGGDLRVAVNLLLAEHVNLAGAATGWAMMGINKNFNAAAGALDANSVDLANAIGLVYGDGAKDAFLPLWRKHIGFYVNYVTATIKQDASGRSKSVNDLMGYAKDFGAFLNAANPNLPADAVESLVKEHVVTLAAMADAQANQDWPKAFEAQRKAAAHMQMISDALAGAIVTQFPDRFGM